jgi:hypothetical protein
VSFKVCNTYRNSVSTMYTSFNEATTVGGVLDRTLTCDAQENVSRNSNQCETYTAMCMESKPMTTVDVYVTEGPGGNRTPLPECCHGDEVDVVHYIFVVMCECPASAPARKLLRGTSTTE